eukprot:12691312-Ditylum_brightwellii.AAC.1
MPPRYSAKQWSSSSHKPQPWKQMPLGTIIKFSTKCLCQSRAYMPTEVVTQMLKASMCKNPEALPNWKLQLWEVRGVAS